MIVIFVEFIDQLIDYPINCASLSKGYGVRILRVNTVSYNLQNDQEALQAYQSPAVLDFSSFRFQFVFLQDIRNSRDLLKISFSIFGTGQEHIYYSYSPKL